MSTDNSSSPEDASGSKNRANTNKNKNKRTNRNKNENKRTNKNNSANKSKRTNKNKNNSANKNKGNETKHKTATGSPTPYDDAFRSMTNEDTELLMPLFAWLYKKQRWLPSNKKIEIRVLESAHPDASGQTTTYSDALCEVIDAGEMSGIYHLEMEAKPDLLRTVEDTDSGKKLLPAIADRLQITYGRSLSAHHDKIGTPSGRPTPYNIAVLALHTSANVPDKLTIKIAGDDPQNKDNEIMMDVPAPSEYTDGETTDDAPLPPIPSSVTTLTVPIVDVSQISVRELIAWRLYFLVPFHIMAYEKLLETAFGTKEKNEEKKKRALAELEPMLRDDYNLIWSALRKDAGFTPHATFDVVRCTENVVRGMCDLRNLTSKDKIANLILPKKEVIDMKAYAKEIEQAGIAKGMAKGLTKGREEGREEERTKAVDAENTAVQNYVDEARQSGKENSAIIEGIKRIWGWSQEKARTAVLGAAT